MSFAQFWDLFLSQMGKKNSIWLIDDGLLHVHVDKLFHLCSVSICVCVHICVEVLVLFAVVLFYVDFQVFVTLLTRKGQRKKCKECFCSLHFSQCFLL